MTKISAKDVLPSETADHHRGYYPCVNWRELPLPLRACTVSTEVDKIIARVFLGNSGRTVEAHFNPEEFIRSMFTRWGPDNPVVDSGNLLILKRDGHRVFAKWWQDAVTGAYCVSAGAYGDSPPAVIQGGFRGHLPDGIYRNSQGRWQMRSTTPGLRVSL